MLSIGSRFSRPLSVKRGVWAGEDGERELSAHSHRRLRRWRSTVRQLLSRARLCEERNRAVGRLTNLEIT